MIERELIYFWYYFTILVKQIAPYWILGIIIGSLVSVFAKDRINKLFESTKESKMGLWGIVPASLLGIISPLCMYGTLPIAASFSKNGMRSDWLAAFMMSSILLNPQLVAYTAVLGPQVLYIRIISSIACGLVAGVLIFVFYRNKPFFNFDGFSPRQSKDTDQNVALRLLKNMYRNVKATGLYFLLGILLTVLFQRYVPSDTFAGLFGNHHGFGVLIAATLGVPVYVCGGGTIPLLLEWLQSGLSIGSATAFMVTGPATKFTNLGAVKIVLGSGRFAWYILYVIAFGIMSGYWVDMVLS